MPWSAPTYQEPHWYTGEVKIRCEEDGKVVYRDEAHAQNAARRITAEREPMYAYKGNCGHWHVSRNKRGR